MRQPFDLSKLLKISELTAVLLLKHVLNRFGTMTNHRSSKPHPSDTCYYDSSARLQRYPNNKYLLKSVLTR